MNAQPLTILRDGKVVASIRGQLHSRSQWAVDDAGGWTRQRHYSLLASPGIDLTEGDLVATTEKDGNRLRVVTSRRVVSIEGRWPKTYALLEGSVDGKSE